MRREVTLGAGWSNWLIGAAPGAVCFKTSLSETVTPSVQVSRRVFQKTFRGDNQMGSRGPLPSPHSRPTKRGTNTFKAAVPFVDPGEWEPATAWKPHTDVIGEYGKELWLDVAPLLKEAGIMTSLDIVAFSLLCSCWHAYRTACDELEIVGEIYETSRGRVESHPLVKIRQGNAKMLQTMFGLFGMTPASRKRHGWTMETKPNVENPLEMLAKRGRNDNQRA